MDQEIELSLQGLGLSLVNNYIRKEVAYLAITRYVYRLLLCLQLISQEALSESLILSWCIRFTDRNRICVWNILLKVNEKGTCQITYFMF